jgi:plasmid maintenance system antidote protein VapI
MKQSLESQVAQELAEFEKTQDGVAGRLRDSLMSVVHIRMTELGWTQRKLATTLGMKPSQLSRILHGDENWTVDTAGRILAGLGLLCELHVIPHRDRSAQIPTEARSARSTARSARPTARPRATPSAKSSLKPAAIRRRTATSSR